MVEMMKSIPILCLFVCMSLVNTFAASADRDQTMEDKIESVRSKLTDCC